MIKKLFLFSIVTLMLTTGCDSSFDGINTTTESVDASKSLETRATDSNQLNYYWYQGKKVFLKQKTTKQYVLFDAEKEPIVSKVIKMTGDNSHVSKTVNLTYVKGLSNVVNDKDLKWCVINNDNTIISDLAKQSDIKYSAPFFETIDNGKEIGISHLFYVKLKTIEDKYLLFDMASKLRVEVLGNNEYMPLWYTLSCDVNSSGNSLQMSNVFYESGLFEYAEPDIIYNIELASTSSTSFPNDPYFNNQWNLDGSNSINWKQAYYLSTGSNVDIAIIDKGADYMHPDFNWKLRPAYDLRSNTMNATNIYGTHGANCAGIICAQVNNNKGLSGISPDSDVYMYAHPLDGHVNSDQELATGIALASQSCDVISCSWGGGAPSNMITDAIHYYALMWGRNGKGVVVVFATGNDDNIVKFPANYNENILAVGATERNGWRASFSNYGSELDVVAPGTEIITTNLLGSSIPMYISNFEGTSAACPHVAGVAALILSVNPDLTSNEVIDIIERTASKVGGYTYSTVTGRPNGTWNNQMGYGLVNAYSAVQEAISMR